MQASQLTWATSSYARKYALNGLFLLDDVKDADATNTHWKETTKKSETKTEKTVEDNPQWWFQKAVSNTKFMKECLSEDDYIWKIKGKYTVDETIESQLREAYKKATQTDDEYTDLLF
jgi:hypothetical protein